MKPYNDYNVDGIHIRIFDSDAISEDELEWHRDNKDRIVTILDGNGWYFQFDNDLPFEMVTGNSINIEEGVYHRIHKGYGDLVLHIEE